jgi:hypothetical protein
VDVASQVERFGDDAAPCFSLTRTTSREQHASTVARSMPRRQSIARLCHH